MSKQIFAIEDKKLKNNYKGTAIMFYTKHCLTKGVQYTRVNKYNCNLSVIMLNFHQARKLTAFPEDRRFL